MGWIGMARNVALLAAVLCAGGLVSCKRSKSSGDDVLPLVTSHMAAGFDFTCAKAAANTVTCVGGIASGVEGGTGTSLTGVTWTFAEEVTSIDAGVSHACAILKDKSVSCWGTNTEGELGVAPFTGTKAEPSRVVGLSEGAVQLALGDKSSCALTESGGVFCWGTGRNLLGGDSSSYDARRIIDNGMAFGNIASGGSHLCLSHRFNKGLVCLGDNTKGQLGSGDRVATTGLVNVLVGEDISHLALGSSHSCASTSGGDVYCWGDNGFGQLAASDLAADGSASPLRADKFAGGALGVLVAANTTCAEHSDQQVTCFGEMAQVLDGSSGAGVTLNGQTSLTSLILGGQHGCRGESGAIVCFGKNDKGQLGTGTANSGVQKTPVAASVLNKADTSNGGNNGGNPAGPFTITYNGNGQTFGTVPTDSSSPYAAGTSATLKLQGDLRKTGHKFVGWNTAANGSGTSYAAGAALTPNANLTLYAEWQALWPLIDGNGATGLNRNVAKRGSLPVLTVFNGKVYAGWNEQPESGFSSQIRVKVFNGNYAAPGWAFVDGNMTTGLNKDPDESAEGPNLLEFDGKLYAAWAEFDSGQNSRQMRVAVYNGNDASPSWAFVDGNGATGLNKDPSEDAGSYQLATVDDKLYAIWTEQVGNINDQVRIAVYNGDDSSPSWTFVDGNGVNGINKDSGDQATSVSPVVADGKLYLTWTEYNGKSQVRVAVYNGNDSSPAWSFVDGNGVDGLNKDPAQSAEYPSLHEHDSKLYLGWNEFSGGKLQVRLAVYNGNDSAPDWSFVDGGGANGFNRDPTKSARALRLATIDGGMIAVWRENNGLKDQVRAARYNGNDSAPAWQSLDGDTSFGINKDTGRTAQDIGLTTLGNRLFAVWSEDYGTSFTSQIRAAVYTAP